MADEQGEAPIVEPESDEDEDLLDRARGTGVGTEDPNIVGDAGPTDIPPGKDPDSLLVEEPLEDHDE